MTTCLIRALYALVWAKTDQCGVIRRHRGAAPVIVSFRVMPLTGRFHRCKPNQVIQLAHKLLSIDGQRPASHVTQRQVRHLIATAMHARPHKCALSPARNLWIKTMKVTAIRKGRLNASRVFVP
jgi:hypothetical protein